MRRALVIFVMVSTSCALDSLVRPAYIRSTGNGLCGSTIALDSNNQKLNERGCENGTVGVWGRGFATKEQAQAVHDAFTPLKAGIECLPTDGGEPRTRVSYTLYEGTTRANWTVCNVADAGVWTALDDAFNAL